MLVRSSYCEEVQASFTDVVHFQSSGPPWNPLLGEGPLQHSPGNGHLTEKQ